MSLHNYFNIVEKKSNLPTAAQSGIGERATSFANREVMKVLMEKKKPSRKHRYTKYADSDRAAIGKWANFHGAASAVKKFRSKYPLLNESTCRAMRNAYIADKKKTQRPAAPVAQVHELLKQKRGPKLLVGEDIDAKIARYILPS